MESKDIFPSAVPPTKIIVKDNNQKKSNFIDKFKIWK
jgi:hypothetical protein